MSVYADGVAAYRDSTKWLVAFVPITTVATGLVATGAPSFRRIRAQSETTLTHLVFAAILTTLALSAVMLSGTRVLDAEPESLSSLQKPKNRATLAKRSVTASSLPTSSMPRPSRRRWRRPK